MTLISTGLPSVDGLLGGGLRPGNLTLICGLSQSGMTTMLDTIAVAAAFQRQTPTVLADLESPTGVRMCRLSSALSGVPFTAIRDWQLTDEQRAAIREADQAGAPFSFAHDIADVADLADAVGCRGGLLLVDGVRLLGDGDTSASVRALADLAAVEGIAVVATHPAVWHPDLPAGDTPTPVLAAADAVLVLHRLDAAGEVEVTGAGRLAHGTTRIVPDFERARFLDPTSVPAAVS